MLYFTDFYFNEKKCFCQRRFGISVEFILLKIDCFIL
jgi:hypothetical protein